MADTKVYRCATTGAEREGKGTRLPRGWRRVGGNYYSPEGWSERYVARAVTLPVVAPVVPPGAGPQSESWRAAWKDLDAALSEAWSRSTHAAAWAMKELLKNDVTREPGMEKCPKMPSIYLYGMSDWTGWSQSAASVLRNIEAAYRARRYETVWLGKSRLPDIRYPYPYPSPAQSYSIEIDDGGRPVFSCRLPAGRVSVWLKGGHNYRRQRKQIEWLIKHPEMRGEAAIYRRGERVMVKIVGWLERKQDDSRDGALYVRTDSESLLLMLNAKEESLLTINGDQCRDWITRHAHWMQRWREDQKAEVRRPRRRQRKSAEDMQKHCRKNNNRVNTYVDQVASQVVGLARRRRLAVIIYDDSVKTYVEKFPWHRLANGIEQRASAEGICFERLGKAEDAVTARTSRKAKEEK